MSSKKAREFTKCIKQFVEIFFADRLRKTGFVNVDDHFITWYRVKNESIVDTVIFHTDSAPFMQTPWLEISYGIQPLFSEPPLIRNACKYPNAYVSFYEKEYFPLQGSFPIGPYSEEIPLCVPSDGEEEGYGFFSTVLPQMDQIQTVEDCFDYHLQDCLRNLSDCQTNERTINPYRNASQCFFDEAIYVNRSDLFPYLIPLAKSYSNSLHTYGGKNQEKNERGDRFQRQMEVMLFGERDAYLKELSNRQHQIMKRLQKLCII